jgi:hypothetical protein
MHLLYCDESNLEDRAGDFFVYGGIIIRSNAARGLSDAIGDARRHAGVSPDFRLKFNPKPDRLSHGDFIALKERIIRLAVDFGAVFLVSMILHDIATSPDDARRNEINRVCYHFDCVLNRYQGPGLVLVDRFSDAQIDAHLVEKFSVGVTGLPYSRQQRLGNIVGFHYSTIGQSHFASLIDIVLGSFRYAINAFSRNDAERLVTARRLLEILAPLFFREAGKATASELGLFFSPKVIRSARYRTKYEELKEFFAQCGIQAEQPITSERQY